ncbi:MAG TPA: mechanosensitive ion channel domain-containing protein [Flavobacteriaceae bacterium]|nr:mechanosensitive ion channel domain-containing protein [Flavobacteriaceae bacterium]
MEKLRDIPFYVEKYADAFMDYLPTLVGALILLVVGWWIIKFLLKRLDKIFTRREVDLALHEFLLTVIGIVLKVLLLLMVIANLGIETTSLLAILGAAGLAVGLALQGSLSNFAGGIIILVLKPFRLGDWIEAQGLSGSVTEISLFYTKLTTFGNQLAIIPNGQLTNDNVVNYTVLGKRRENLIFKVSYGSDIRKAKEIFAGIIEEQENILKDPAPQVLISDLGENAVNFSIRYWAMNDDFWDCHWYTIEQANYRLQNAGVHLSIPQRFIAQGKKDDFPLKP